MYMNWTTSPAKQAAGSPAKQALGRRSCRRAAVTLMECIFAIGVVLTGLVGLAALIPIASQNARDTIEIDRSISESTSASAVGVVQSFHDLDSLVMFDKPVQGSLANAAGGYVPTNAMQTLESKLSNAPLKLESPGYMHMLANTGLTGGICIDPLGIPDLALLTTSFVTAPNVAQPFVAPVNTDSAFDYSRFPYFNERYNVLASPNEQIGDPAAVNNATRTTPWPMGPRMYRVTLKSPMFDSQNFMRRYQLMSPSITRNIFGGSNGLSNVDAPEKELPRGVLTETTLVGGNRLDAGRDNASDYTWFATLTPNFLGGDSFRQSIVVVRKRLAPVPRRVDDPFALQKTNYTIDDADDNPTSERLAWIDPETAIGFNGGSGGEVSVFGSQGVTDDISSNSWVMLSRQPHRITGPPLTLRADGPAVHRWYRVISVGEAELTSNYAWAGGTNDVWGRRLSLAGPDWAFQDETTGNTTPIDDTFCTIIEGAVSVIESEVKFE